jgi:hypothetical protein
MLKLLLALTLVPALCFHLPARSRQSDQFQPRRRGRALLVGINTYRNFPQQPTPGSEEDAEATREFIARRYGFQDGGEGNEIKVLKGSEATRAGILDWFRRWLIEGTQPGERVFFLYSGHGSRVADDDGDESSGASGDRMDETLAPYDVSADPASHIRDDEINRLVSELAGRVVVMVFDSCHSGTISRELGAGGAQPSGVKYLPSPEELAALRAARSPGASARDGYIVLPSPRDLKLTSVPLDRQAVSSGALVVFSAARSGQLAYPISTPAGPRGALSYTFNELQRDRLPKLGELQAAISRRLIELYQNRQLPRQQEPVVEVLGRPQLHDEPLFGAELSAPVHVLNHPASAIRLSLRTLDGRRAYRLREPIAYEVTTDTPGYLYLIVFSQANVATCVFPNRENADDADNYVTQGAHRLPRSESFYAQEPTGRDVVVALLSSQRLSLGEKENYTWDEIFDRLRSRKFFDFVQSRGQTAKRPQATPSAPGATLEQVNWQAASLTLETTR